jgi:hypothetical protein
MATSLEAKSSSEQCTVRASDEVKLILLCVGCKGWSEPARLCHLTTYTYEAKQNPRPECHRYARGTLCLQRGCVHQQSVEAQSSHVREVTLQQNISQVNVENHHVLRTQHHDNFNVVGYHSYQQGSACFPGAHVFHIARSNSITIA